MAEQIDSILNDGSLKFRRIVEDQALANLQYFQKLDGTRSLQQLYIVRVDDQINHQWRDVPIVQEEAPTSPENPDQEFEPVDDAEDTHA